MSRQIINQYYNNLERAIQFGKSRNETAIRNHFWILLNDYARKLHYEVVTEVKTMGTKGRAVQPDGIVKNLFGLDIGLWESKDEKTSIDEEINLKIKIGYPLTNILFEDSATVILYQRGEQVMRIAMRDADKLHELITLFVSFKNETVHQFEVALENFKADIPQIVETLRFKIDENGATNLAFVAARNTFLELCKAEINPEITLADIREMMIQHVLTSDIFNKIFDDPEFHRHNNIARELENLVDKLFSYAERKNLLGSIEHYYDAINAAAARVTDHHEKQKFLKVLYENFYKVYNPKAADRLGVVYTPNEIVQFMIESTDHLLHRHFGKTLADKDVDILDPATGTGTFISAIIDHIPSHLLVHKYKHELHANEVAILPYYIANLNVEFTFKQKMGYYEEFTSLCFVDTLDNVDALKMVRRDKGHQTGMFGFSSENSSRIKKQNEKKISVVIGNPPYNANQANENDNNKNRTYPVIDKHIKETFIKESTAQKTKVYDMYARFYRWAMDRLNDKGIIAFITNRSFIDSRTFDGFRKCIEADFAACYIIDTRSDVRANPKIAGTTHNVFGIQTGVAVMFLVKKESADVSPSLPERAGVRRLNNQTLPTQNEHDATKCRIYYTAMEDQWRKEMKLDWFRNNRFNDIAFEHILPDKNGNWINMVENDFESLVPLKDIFSIRTNGISTNRDEWVYDKDQKNLKSKIEYFSQSYNTAIKKNDIPDNIKLSRDLKSKLSRKLVLNSKTIEYRRVSYRPFLKIYTALNSVLIDVIGLNKQIFASENNVICLDGSDKVLATDTYADLHFVGDSKCLPFYRYDAAGNRQENITDWALNLFQNYHTQNEPASPVCYADSDELRVEFKPEKNPDKKSISKEDIFHYTYAVLHNPAYRKKYELNLKREFPRIPLYTGFWQWAAWGKQLMELHIGYENVAPFALKKVEVPDAKPVIKPQKSIFPVLEDAEVLYTKTAKLKVKLKVDKTTGAIELDEKTTLSGIPPEAWEYKLGNRSALEWVLDQYKEKKPSDPTIAEKFNTYRFADYKEHVIDLLMRVCTVSVETMKVVRAMEEKGIRANTE